MLYGYMYKRALTLCLHSVVEWASLELCGESCQCEVFCAEREYRNVHIACAWNSGFELRPVVPLGTRLLSLALPSLGRPVASEATVVASWLCCGVCSTFLGIGGGGGVACLTYEIWVSVFARVSDLPEKFSPNVRIL
jgi:hypothetical protein